MTMISQIVRASALSFLLSLSGGFCLSGGASAQTMTLDVCPTDYGSFPEDAPPLSCTCSADAAKAGDVRGANPYYYQSSLCRAAVHAGAIGETGGQILVEPAHSPFFPAVTRNGVAADSWSDGMGFRVVVSAAPAAPPPAAEAPAAPTAPPPAAEAPAATPPPPAAAAPAPATPAPSAGMTLDICPTDYGSFPEDAPALTCGCSAEAVKTGDIRGANPYYYQSALCRAALHAGAVGAAGGQIVVEPASQLFFPAVTRNGVEADSWSEGAGFKVSAAPGATTTAIAPIDAANKAGLTLDVCPVDYSSFPEDAPTLTCGCAPEAVKEGDLRGANPYYYQSALCRSALHAGAVGSEGGQIVVDPAPQPFYPAVIRNGVESDSWDAGMGFKVSSAPGAATAAVPAIDARGATQLTLDVCPTDYSAFPEDAPPVTCPCSADAVKEGDVRGTNPYYYQSSICRAALHAGVTGATGKDIVIGPEKAPFFPAVTKNGVESDSWDAGMGFKVSPVPGAAPIATAPPPAPPAAEPAVDASGQPVQAPIAETLKATGRVQLYINFATDQAEPLPTSEPVLQELLATLQGDPALRVELIGHTDSQGSAPYNLDLSQRRAAAIYLWLTQHGIETSRLRSDGRGLLEPIADNETDQGRALNRRVEVKAVN